MFWLKKKQQEVPISLKSYEYEEIITKLVKIRGDILALDTEINSLMLKYKDLSARLTKHIHTEEEDKPTESGLKSISDEKFKFLNPFKI